jgi:hypothetical protein
MKVFPFRHPVPYSNAKILNCPTSSILHSIILILEVFKVENIWWTIMDVVCLRQMRDGVEKSDRRN